MNVSDSLRSMQLNLFQKILLTTDGSVTKLLSLYTGEAISARRIEQSVRSGGAPAALVCPVDAPLLHRKIMLVDGHRNLVFAESVFIVERLSPSLQRRLHDSDTPIGSLWDLERSEIYREIIDIHAGPHPATAGHFGLPMDTPMMSRTYLLQQHAAPLGIITERFPADSFNG